MDSKIRVGELERYDSNSMESKNVDNEIEAAKSVFISLDLVSCAKKHLQFVKMITNMPWLHHGTLVVRAIKRYIQLWMPLMAELGTQENMLVPPIDVQWVWHCHCLNPDEYRKFCMEKFSKIIDTCVLLDAKAETDALQRCKKIWSERFPREPFDLRNKTRLPSSDGAVVHPIIDVVAEDNNKVPQQENSDNKVPQQENSDLVFMIYKQSQFYLKQSYGPYMREAAFLEAAKERYKLFLHLINKYRGSFSFVPTLDIILMWTTHQSYPMAYAKDVQWIEGLHRGAVLERAPNNVPEDDLTETARLWEMTYNRPYEKAGATFDSVESKPLPIPKALGGTLATPKPIHWDCQDVDVNSAKHPTLQPRHVMEVCVFVQVEGSFEGMKDMFLRLKAVDAYKKLRLDRYLSKLSPSKWHRLWTLQCEVSSKGLMAELHSLCMSSCCINFIARRSRSIDEVQFEWDEILQSSSTMVEKSLFRKPCPLITVIPLKRLQPRIRIMVSVTPPIQAPYLLKCVPDRVTDDSGAMLSDKVVKMNKHAPQEGRWISRTVLDHTGKECFVVRIRVARGRWRRSSGDRPVGVDWNERVIQVREGSWRYLSGALGVAPEKVVGTANPIADDLQNHRMIWSLSTGETLTIQMPIQQLDWERHLEFTLKDSPKGKPARLLNGRKLQYEVVGANPEEEEGFVTLVRYRAGCQQGKATALLNWKVSAVEFLAEEDGVMVLLLCNAIVRTVADFGGDNIGNFFIRRRMKEAKPGTRDWGSVVDQSSQGQKREMMFWYLNPREVLGLPPPEQHPPPLTSEEETHVYRSGSWLYPVETPNRSFNSERFIRKVGSYSFGGDNGRVGGGGSSSSGSSNSTRRSRSGLPPLPIPNSNSKHRPSISIDI